MIQPQDLRISNWVKCKDGFVTIDAINNYEVLVVKNTKIETVYGYSGIEPIPLTEDILLKAGFRVHKSPDYDTYTSEGLCLMYCASPSGYLVALQLHKELYIKYLHQLQNIFYSLTGEELTINI